MSETDHLAEPQPPQARAVAPLLGRDEELAALARLTADEGCGLVTIVGPAGVGKTRVALEHLAREAEQGTRHTLFVPLGAVREAELVRDEVVAQLPGGRSLAATTLGALWERYGGAPLLLLLDGVDQLPDVGDLIDHLLSGYARLHIVTTGLRPVHAHGEQVVRIRPLPTPDDGAAGSTAMALFARQATAVDGGFQVTGEVLADVASICRSVGGLPLAIELAAARVSSIPPAVMARQLAEGTGIRLLHAEHPLPDDRHSSMESTLDWAYALLSDPDQSLLVQLTVFEGPFTLEGAGAVVLPSPASSAEMLDRLSGLVDLQLVDLTLDDPSTPRFSLTPLVRGYAGRRLSSEGAEAAVRSRHARYFQARCHSGVPLRRDELADTIKALDRAILDGHVDDALHAAVASTRALVPGPGAARTTRSRMDELSDRSSTGPVDTSALARALVWSATRSGQPDGDTTYAEWMAEHVRAALATARRSGDQRAVLSALELTVRALPTTLDARSARAAVDEGMELARGVEDQAAFARFEMYAAMAARAGGDADRAARLAARALDDAGATADLGTTTSAALLLRGAAPDILSRVPALPTLEELLEQCERDGDRRAGYRVLSALTTEALDRGDLDDAVRHVHSALVVTAEWRRTDPIASLVPLGQLLSVAIARGDLEVATSLHASVARFEPLLAFALPPDAFAQFRRAADLMSPRSDDGGVDHPAGATPGLDQCSELALTYTRSLLVRSPAARLGHTTPAPAAGSLTSRERDVLVELADGGTNKEIAEVLGMSAKTVMHHSMSIYRKLGVRGRSEATAWAFRHGLVGR